MSQTHALIRFHISLTTDGQMPVTPPVRQVALDLIALSYPDGFIVADVSGTPNEPGGEEAWTIEVYVLPVDLQLVSAETTAADVLVALGVDNVVISVLPVVVFEDVTL